MDFIFQVQFCRIHKKNGFAKSFGGFCGVVGAIQKGMTIRISEYVKV
jgi:hypothetical protein